MTAGDEDAIASAGRPTIHAILDAMSLPSTNYHGATLELRALDGLVLVETRHPACSRVAQHAHDAPTLCVPLSGGFEEVVGRARLAVAAPAVVARAAGEPHADRFGARDVRCFNVVLGRAWLGRHGLDALPWRGVRFELASVPAVAPGVPLVGGEVLRRFRIFFDYARSRMTVEPNPHLHDRFALSAPALQLRGMPGDGAVRVHEIPAQSAAARAGLAPGDLITAVDGTPAADLGFMRLQALLRRAGTFALTVRRAGRSISVLLENPSPAATPAASH